MYLRGSTDDDVTDHDDGEEEHQTEQHQKYQVHEGGLERPHRRTTVSQHTELQTELNH